MEPVLQDPALSPHRLGNIVMSYEFKIHFNIIFPFMHSCSRCVCFTSKMIRIAHLPRCLSFLWEFSLPCGSQLLLSVPKPQRWNYVTHPTYQTCPVVAPACLRFLCCCGSLVASNGPTAHLNWYGAWSNYNSQRKKQSYLEKNAYQCHFVQPNSHMYRPGIEPGSSRWEDVTNLLSVSAFEDINFDNVNNPLEIAS
jgi:hypothetical protein